MSTIANARHGLPPCLWVPIAASDLDAIEKNVGLILSSRTGEGGVSAVCVLTKHRASKKDHRVPLWQHPSAAKYEERLFPTKQVWVHVDYTRYRAAYEAF